MSSTLTPTCHIPELERPHLTLKGWLTSRQIQALVAARDKGGAVYGRGHASLMGGAYRRMCEKLALAGLVEDFPPFPITDLGRQALSFYNSPHPNAEC